MKSQLKKKFKINAGIVALVLVVIGLPSVYFATTSKIGSYTTGQEHASGFDATVSITGVPSGPSGSLTPPSKEAADQVAKDSQAHLAQLNAQLNQGNIPSSQAPNYYSCEYKTWVNWSGDYYRNWFWGYQFAEMDMLVDYYQHWVTCADGNGFGGMWVSSRDTQDGYFDVGDIAHASGWRTVSPFGGYNYGSAYAGSVPGHHCIIASTTSKYAGYYYYVGTPTYCY